MNVTFSTVKLTTNQSKLTEVVTVAAAVIVSCQYFTINIELFVDKSISKDLSTASPSSSSMDNVDTTSITTSLFEASQLSLQHSNEPNENEDASNVIVSSASNECIVAVAKNYRAELLIIGDDSIGSKSSLQSSFLKFRDQKMKERQLMKACCRGANTTTRTIEFKDSLRAKFIETAKRYIGVPYGLKYKKEDDPIAPLYLDCCGLVRQVLLDLQDDFGFVIGKWNQAYQLDTLPGVLSEEELRPGDLIFYEGKYVSERSKKQKHNSVHVEIFLGGETGKSLINTQGWFHSSTASAPLLHLQYECFTVLCLLCYAQANRRSGRAITGDKCPSSPPTSSPAQHGPSCSITSAASTPGSMGCCGRIARSTPGSQTR